MIVYLTKWPMVYPLPDQKGSCIVETLANEIVPESQKLSCQIAGPTYSRILGGMYLWATWHPEIEHHCLYYPQCDGMVERFNRTLTSTLSKHVSRFGTQWDRYLSGVLWAYRNTPHESTGEKPSFLLFGPALDAP